MIHAYDAYRLGVVALCMANGLGAEDAKAVMDRLGSVDLASGSIQNTYEVLARVISEARDERQRR